MENENFNLLNEEIARRSEELKGLTVGTDEFKSAVDALTKLVDRSIELEKIDLERKKESSNGVNQANDLAFKLEQLEEEKKDRKIKNYITVGGIVLPLGVTVWGALKSWRFDKTDDMITSGAGKEFMRKLFSKK